jgi:hypothetical protein
MSKADDFALAFTNSIVVQTLELGVCIWKYKIMDKKYGYYVATRQMTADEYLNCGCVYPKLDGKGRITALSDAILYAKDRIRWAKVYMGYSNADKVDVTVLNGPIMVVPLDTTC